MILRHLAEVKRFAEDSLKQKLGRCQEVEDALGRGSMRKGSQKNVLPHKNLKLNKKHCSRRSRVDELHRIFTLPLCGAAAHAIRHVRWQEDGLLWSMLVRGELFCEAWHDMPSTTWTNVDAGRP